MPPIPLADIAPSDTYQIQSLSTLGLEKGGVTPIEFTAGDNSYILILVWLSRHQEYWHVLRDSATGTRIKGGNLHPDEQRTFRGVTGDVASPDLRIWFASRLATPPPMRPDTIGNNYYLHIATGRFRV